MHAAPDRVFTHIGRIEHLPRYGAPLWMTAESVEKRRNTQVVALTGYLIGLPIESVQRVTLRPPTAVEFKQVRGTLRMFNGQCSLAGVEDGTEVRYRLEVDLGIAMISDDAARQFLVQFVERFLDRIKLAAERKTPLPRPAAATGVGVAVADDEEEKETVGAGVQDEGGTEALQASEDEEPGEGAPHVGASEDRPAVRSRPPAAAQGAQGASPIGAHPAGSQGAPGASPVRAHPPSGGSKPERGQRQADVAPSGGSKPERGQRQTEVAPFGGSKPERGQRQADVAAGSSEARAQQGPGQPGQPGRRRRRRHRRRGRSHGSVERGGHSGPPA